MMIAVGDLQKISSMKLIVSWVIAKNFINQKFKTFLFILKCCF